MGNPIDFVGEVFSRISDKGSWTDAGCSLLIVLFDTMEEVIELSVTQIGVLIVGHLPGTVLSVVALDDEVSRHENLLTVMDLVNRLINFVILSDPLEEFEIEILECHGIDSQYRG